jgi:hypothetical protein
VSAFCPLASNAKVSRTAGIRIGIRILLTGLGSIESSFGTRLRISNPIQFGQFWTSPMKPTHALALECPEKGEQEILQ